MPDAGVTLCAIIRVPECGLAAFLAYEDVVLPLLAAHGGRLERRLRAAKGDAGETTEIHVLWFPSAAHLDAYRSDPLRAANGDPHAATGALVEIFAVQDIGPGAAD